MIILNLEQNTPEWEAYRRTKVGASDVPTLMIGSDAEVYSLLMQKRSGEKIPTNHHMERGHRLEPDARAYYELVSGQCFPKVTALSSEHEHLMASFDGLSVNQGLEIKCPETIPACPEDSRSFSRYWWQIQAQMAVSDRDSFILLLYSPDKQVETEIRRDTQAIDQLIEKSAWFHRCLMGEEEMDVPFVEREDSDWENAAVEWKKAKELLDQAKEYEAICRESLLYLADNKSSIGAGVKVSISARKGAIDTTRLAKETGIDLEIYRKAGVISARITEIAGKEGVE